MTTTELRTKTSQLINTLKKKGTVSLIHRSKIVATIRPVEPKGKPFDVKKFNALLKQLPKLGKLTYKEREKKYSKHLMEKYGQHLSRR